VTEPVAVTFDGRSSVTGAPCFLRITLLSRSHAQINELEDREVTDCEVSVDADVFRGQYR
jgi:hypothetical protein